VPFLCDPIHNSQFFFWAGKRLRASAEAGRYLRIGTAVNGPRARAFLRKFARRLTSRALKFGRACSPLLIANDDHRSPGRRSLRAAPGSRRANARYGRMAGRTVLPSARRRKHRGERAEGDLSAQRIRCTTGRIVVRKSCLRDLACVNARTLRMSNLKAGTAMPGAARSTTGINYNTRVGTCWVGPDYTRKKGREKGKDSMAWNWRDLVMLTFFVLLFGAAMIANVSDGPLPEHRGTWVTHALR